MRRVGKQDCFASLPIPLLEAFLSEQMPSFPVVLELRLPGKKGRGGPWFVAWDGSASRTSHIEVSEKFADCIGLENGTRVIVRARAEVAVADTVAIEPASEDDWEMLELNAEFLEEHLITRVGVLYEGQRFPVWIESGSVLLLQASTTSPSKLVRLEAGAELIVAPKKRQVSTSSNDVKVSAENGKLDRASVWTGHAWLRVQELHPSLVQSVHVGELVCFSDPTTAMFLCPLTAKKLRLSHGQLVTLSEFSVKTRLHNLQSGEQESVFPTEADGFELGNGRVKVKTAGRRVVVRAVVTDLAKPGHIMLAQSLQTYLGLSCHARIGIHSCGDPSASMPALLEFFPAVFEETEENGDESLQVNKSRVHVGRKVERVLGRWSNHKEFLASVGESQRENGIHRLSHNEDVKNSEETQRSVTGLLHAWLVAQAAVFSCDAPSQLEKYVPVSGTTIVHLRPSQQSVRIKDSESRGTHRALKSSVKQDQKDLLFLIGFQNHSNDGSSPTQALSNAATLDESNLYIMLESQMFLDEQEPFSRKASGTVSDSKRILPVKVGSFETISCRSLSNCYETCGPTLFSLRWLGESLEKAFFRVKLLLSPTITRNCFDFTGTVLLHGPPACGKTTVALALARELQADPSVLAHRVIVRCNKLVGEQASSIRNLLQDAVSEALDHAPALVILDDLDALLPKEEGPEPATAVMALAEFLGDLMDLYQGGKQGMKIAFLATARSPMAIPDSLCLSGRFDYHVDLPTPAASERATILEEAVAARGFLCSSSVASEVAMSFDGADRSDLDVLVDRAAHAAAARFLSPGATNESITEWLLNQSLSSRREKFELFSMDFKAAQHDFVPSAMQGIAKGGDQAGRSGWDDVGGLLETRRALQEVLELPVKYGSMFKGAPLRLRSGVLLYGPPGCGKTHIVGAAAAACSLRFISVKGPELLNKYIGASEQAVRDVFAKAAAAAPALLFFDEFDAIAPKRGHDNTGVTDRVVNQLLTELDGVEALNGVFVFAATSRPDLLDAALLRPGRLDRMLLCDFPTTSERAEILHVLSRKLSFAEDVDLDTVAAITDGFSAADLQAVCSDAQLESVHTFLANREGTAPVDSTAKPLITMQHLQTAARNARPSVPEAERRKLNDIYASFMETRRTTPSKSQENKGKRATLA